MYERNPHTKCMRDPRPIWEKPPYKMYERSEAHVFRMGALRPPHLLYSSAITHTKCMSDLRWGPGPVLYSTVRFHLPSLTYSTVLVSKPVLFSRTVLARTVLAYSRTRVLSILIQPNHTINTINLDAWHALGFIPYTSICLVPWHTSHFPYWGRAFERDSFKDPHANVPPLRNEKGVISQSFWYL
jgi:hypothetical protein